MATNADCMNLKTVNGLWFVKHYKALRRWRPAQLWEIAIEKQPKHTPGILLLRAYKEAHHLAQLVEISIDKETT